MFIIFLAYSFEDVVQNQLHMNTCKNKSATNGAQLEPIGLPRVCCYIRPPNSNRCY